MEPFEIVVTGDGSQSVFSSEFNALYHSRHGARTESEHIFINSGFLAAPPRDPLRVLEVGFGTGLNAFLTWRRSAAQRQHVHYTAIDLRYLPAAIYMQLAPTSDPGELMQFRQLHEAPLNTEVRIDERFTFIRREIDIASGYVPGTFDVVYFDAFAPGDAAAMWDAAVFTRIYGSMSAGGVLTTFCSKSRIRRSMQDSGFSVEKLPGPPGKREVTRAWKR